MSYNGIGLQTARGSGTSGHVQKNLAGSKDGEAVTGMGHHRRRELEREHEQRKQELKARESNKSVVRAEIDEHNRKREIDIKCMELRDSLEDESEDEDIIETKVKELRESLLASYTHDD